MSSKALKQENFNNRQLGAVQDNIASATKTLRTSPFSDGVQLTGIVLTGGAQSIVSHKLGRPHRGWIVTRLQLDAIGLAEHPTEITGNSSSTGIALETTTTCIVDLWVF